MVSLVLSLVGSEVEVYCGVTYCVTCWKWSRGLLWCHLFCHLVEVKCEVEVYCSVTCCVTC